MRGASGVMTSQRAMWPGESICREWFAVTLFDLLLIILQFSGIMELIREEDLIIDDDESYRTILMTLKSILGFVSSIIYEMHLYRLKEADGEDENEAKKKSNPPVSKPPASKPPVSKAPRKKPPPPQQQPSAAKAETVTEPSADFQQLLSLMQRLQRSMGIAEQDKSDKDEEKEQEISEDDEDEEEGNEE